jgi:hypothetical protein
VKLNQEHKSPPIAQEITKTDQKWNVGLLTSASRVRSNRKIKVDAGARLNAGGSAKEDDGAKLL